MIWRAAVLGFILGGFVGTFIGGNATENEWHKWAIDNGYAHFDSKTGALVLHTKKEITP